MSARWLSLAVVVVSITGYHLAQRSMPDNGQPAPMFAFVYSAAAVIMIATIVIRPSAGTLAEIAGTARHWTPWLLVVSVTGIELGVFAMYRAGWNISSASVTTQSIVAAVLVVVGLLRFGEHLTIGRSAGLVFCLAGARCW